MFDTFPLLNNKSFSRIDRLLNINDIVFMANLQANYPDCCPVYDCEEGTEVSCSFWKEKKSPLRVRFQYVDSELKYTKLSIKCLSKFLSTTENKRPRPMFHNKTFIFIISVNLNLAIQVVYVTPPSTKKAEKKEGE